MRATASSSALTPRLQSEPTYGEGEAYNDFYINQLIELLTHYGPCFPSGSTECAGEGPNGKVQVCDWQRTTIRSVPGNEAAPSCVRLGRALVRQRGRLRSSRLKWSVVTSLREAERTAERRSPEG